MECPYCGAELRCEDHYGTGRQEYFYGTAGNGIYYPSTYKKLGNIYRCPNVDGFSTYEEVIEYIDGNEDSLEEYCNQHGALSWDEVVCDSNDFNGLFYTDSSGNLHEGYPC